MIHIKVYIYNIIKNMDQISNLSTLSTLSTLSNPFEKIDPITDSLRFKKLISNIKDRNQLVEIGKMIEKRLREFSELN